MSCLEWAIGSCPPTAENSYIRVAAAEVPWQPGSPGEVDMSYLLSSVVGSATTILVALGHIVANGFKW
jgi:hypothetical protein